MSRLIECRVCGGLVPRVRTKCPHCQTLVPAIPSKVGGIAAGVVLSASLVGCGAGGSAPSLSPPVADSGPIPIADYGIVILPDGGRDAGTDAGKDAGPDAGQDAGPEPERCCPRIPPGADYGGPILCDDGGISPCCPPPNADYGVVLFCDDDAGVQDAGPDDAGQ